MLFTFEYRPEGFAFDGGFFYEQVLASGGVRRPVDVVHFSIEDEVRERLLPPSVVIPRRLVVAFQDLEVFDGIIRCDQHAEQGTGSNGDGRCNFESVGIFHSQI